ncbi:hypothetical protein EGW08_004947 [Elysia chlorotica]|uniref:Coiled-coil domain-containing protein 22 homolog n=1 Tax=Elysia chlorotica TaxID=188477 RepID=A0A433U0C8_ELYCH|nr:hypothetical protein EGW08_004947 [Elysia chlorotica]
MEEVDRIIIHSLRSIGCDLEDDIQSLRQFGTELIVATVVRCLKIIVGDIDLPSTLPPGMSARFRLGASLANQVQDLGYKGGDLGYQTFLYSNETEIRRIFMFLVEKLPKETSQASDEPMGSSVLLQRAISSELASQLASAWTPPFLKEKGIRTRAKLPGWQREGACCLQYYHSCHIKTPVAVGNLSVKIPKELRAYYSKRMPYVTNQTSRHKDTAPSVMETNSLEVATQQDWDNEWNQVGLASRLSQQDEEKTLSQVGAAVPTKDTEEEMEKKRQEEVDVLRSELAQLTSDLERLDLEVRKFTASKQQMEETISSEQSEREQKQAAHSVKKRTLDLLPDAEANIGKLQSVVDNSAQRLVNLAKQWETHRGPLIEQYRQLRQYNSKRESEAQKKLEEIKQFRERMKEVADDARKKDELQKQLVSEYERMTKDVNRSAYTRKIMEIVSNIKKQKQEIDKILVDTRSVQKEINSLTGKLDRTFTVTDELIFRDAKKDDGVKKAYRFLAALHENFEQLIQMVEDTGAVVREIKDLEDQIETESNNKVLQNLEKITADFQEMKKENTALIAKVKGKK